MVLLSQTRKSFKHISLTQMNKKATLNKEAIFPKFSKIINAKLILLAVIAPFKAPQSVSLQKLVKYKVTINKDDMTEIKKVCLDCPQMACKVFTAKTEQWQGYCMVNHKLVNGHDSCTDGE